MAALLDVDGETAPAGTAASLVAGGDERVNVDPTATDSLRAVASAMAALLDIGGETLACDDIPAPADTASDLIAGGDECDLYLALSFTPDFFRRLIRFLKTKLMFFNVRQHAFSNQYLQSSIQIFNQ